MPFGTAPNTPTRMSKGLFLAYDFKSIFKDYKFITVVNAVKNIVYFTRGRDIITLEITEKADKEPILLYEFISESEKNDTGNIVGIFPLPEKTRK